MNPEQINDTLDGLLRPAELRRDQPELAEPLPGPLELATDLREAVRVAGLIEPDMVRDFYPDLRRALARGRP